jgi:hypothetical protein
MLFSKIIFRNFFIRSKVLQILTLLRENRHFIKKYTIPYFKRPIKALTNKIKILKLKGF